MRATLMSLLIAAPAAATPDAMAVGVAARERPGGYLGALEIRATAVAAMTGTATSAVPVDDEGRAVEPDPALDSLARVGLTVDTARLSSWINAELEAEYEIVNGIFDGGSADDAEVIDPPLEEGTASGLRKASGRLSFGPFLTVGGGFMVSHWGLGLLANDGEHGWTPGSAAFSDPRGGDQVLRAFLATGPWTDAELMVIGAYDQVRDDDVLRSGDEASQMVMAVTLGDRERRHVGVYGVRRRQEARDGKETTVTVADLYGIWGGRFRQRWRYQVAAEVAVISGETELGPSTEFPTHDVAQVGAATRLRLWTADFGVSLDAAFASGDADAADGAQNGFKADPDYEQGLLLFRHVLAAGSGRSPVSAADPDLVGYPADDLERLTTRGSITNTLTFFPRAWTRPTAGLEIYGGPLFAFAAVEPIDPRASRLAGGVPRNGFDGSPGRYLGTELDLGIRYRALLWGTELVVGVEGGLFTPGSALEDADGNRRGAMSGGRAMLRYTL